METLNQEIFEQISKLISSGRINQVTLAKRCGYSGTVISQYLQGKYPGDLTLLENKLQTYLEHAKSIQQHKKIKLNFEKTTVAARIFQVMQMCRLNSEIGICFGASGLGKTTAIKQYEKQNSGVIIIDPNENSRPRAILKQIAEQLKVSESICTDDFISDIVKRLKDSEYLIIVDEGENLKTDCFRTLRKIHDRCSFTFGLLFMGTERLFGNLSRIQGEFDYVTNRIGYVERLDGLKNVDIEILVKQIFPNCSIEMLRAFEDESNKNARILFNVLKRTHDLVVGGLELCPKTIKIARNMLGARK